MTELNPTPCDSCAYGMTGMWFNLCARCGGSGFLTATAARAALRATLEAL